METTISNSDNVIDSRDIIARIEELESELQSEFDERLEAGTTGFTDFDTWLEVTADSDNESAKFNYCDEAKEYLSLKALAEEGENSPDWFHCETLIHDNYFTQYIEELINDCYEMPKEMNSGAWPWRHITIDYEAAADEAKQDYFSLDFDGETYWIRA